MAGLALWLIAAVVLAIGELLTPGMFFLGPVALAAVAAAITSALGGGIVLELIVFIAASAASVSIPSELGQALGQLGSALGDRGDAGAK